MLQRKASCANSRASPSGARASSLPKESWSHLASSASSSSS
uniref:Uncharacterized protein n=1 Tax=Arundo donax TaxID=35708 RepID=A0A0A9GVF0_ARUDO